MARAGSCGARPCSTTAAGSTTDPPARPPTPARPPAGARRPDAGGGASARGARGLGFLLNFRLGSHVGAPRPRAHADMRAIPPAQCAHKIPRGPKRPPDAAPICAVPPFRGSVPPMIRLDHIALVVSLVALAIALLGFFRVL